MSRASERSPAEIRLQRRIDRAVLIVGVLMVLYHLVATQRIFFSITQHLNLHFTFAATLVLLISLKKMPKRLPLLAGLMLLVVVATTYMHINDDVLKMRSGYPNNVDMVIGVILVFLAFELSRQAFGLALPIIALVFVGYLLLGQYLPGPFYHQAIEFSNAISHLAVGFDGMYGQALDISASNIYLFLVFGALLESAGANDFFFEVGKIAGKILKGGPAQTAVFGSCLVGMVSGSAMANAGVVGPVTIPLMKKLGYRPKVAAAIEAAASAGGQVMPPVMGASAFLMAGVLGMPYARIMLAAIVPALLYYFAVCIFVELQARKQNLIAPSDRINWNVITRKGPLFLGPLIFITILLLQGFSPMKSAFWAITSVVVLSLIHKETRRSLRQWMDAFAKGSVAGAQIAVTCAVTGLIMVTVTMSAIGITLSATVVDWAHGILILGALLTMLASLILGCGVPTMPAYILVAIMVAPAFQNWGVSQLQSHFFCFYFAVLSAVTPPVAVAALVTSAIAGSKYFETGIQAFKIVIPGLVIPFILLWNQTFFFRAPDITSGILTMLATVLAITAVAAVTNGYFMGRLNAVKMAAIAASAIALFGYAVTLQYAFLGGGLALFALLVVWQMRAAAENKIALGEATK